MREKDENLVEVKVSTCPVCGGEVVEASEVREGPRGRHSAASAGIYCRRCGVKFQFPPPRFVRAL